LVIISFFYFFVVGSAVQAKVYTFHYRVTYENIFLTHVTSLNLDVFILLSTTVAWIYLSVNAGHRKSAIIIFFSGFLVLFVLNDKTVPLVGAALTLPFVICLIILDRFWTKVTLKHNVRLSLNYITMATILLASSGIGSLVLHIITGITTVTVEQYTYAIFQQLLSLLTPMIMASLVFCIPLKVLLIRFINKIKSHTLLIDIIEDKLSNKRVAICLCLCVILGVSVAFIAHRPIINPNNERLGVDTPRYVEWLNHMKNQTTNPIYFVLKGDRPLTLLTLFLMTQATKADPFQVAEYSPILFVPLLVMVTFFLTRQLTANDRISILASFLSAISFQALIGIYSGFYANLLALILGYLAFGLLVKYLKRPSKFNTVALAVVMTGALLAHTYTWTIIIAVAFIFLFMLHILNYYPKKRFLLLYLILSSSIAVDVLKSSWTGSSTGLEADVSIGFGRGLGISQFSERLGTLADTVQTYYGGVFANIAILGLAMYWLIGCQPRQPANLFLLIFMSMALIPLFIGDWVLQSRVLYEIPFQIPAAISLSYIGKKNGKMIFIALLLITGYLSFHVLANLGYVPTTNPLSIIQR
jgi:hypothetical protein